MDGTMRRYGLQTSPERTKVWTEPPTKHQPPQAHYPQHQQLQQQQQVRRVPIVYYLCKNRHLEHPHFIEVPVSSPEGLYLRDVLRRLNVLRGKKMAAMYSWSCKRSYKNGFVWHDLAEDDLIFPAQGNEYVLKGSELLDQSPTDRTHRVPSNVKIQNAKYPLQESPVSCRTVEACSSSPMVVAIRDAKSHSSSPPSPSSSVHLPSAQEGDLSQRLASSEDLSPKPVSRTPTTSHMGSQSPVEYRVCKPCEAQDASTQTDSRRTRKTCEASMFTLGVSMDDRPPDMEFSDSRRDPNLSLKEGCEIIKEERSPPPTSTCPPSCGKTNTLEALIRDEVNKRNNLRITEQGEIILPTRTKLKATSTLMQLLTCGSISVKDHYSFGLVPTYGSMFMNMKLPAPAISNSVMSGEIDCLPDNHRSMGLGVKKEYFSGSIIEANNKETLPVLKRSSSSDDDRCRNCKMPDARRDVEKAVHIVQSKCLPRASKVASCKTSRTDRNAILISSVSETGNSLAELDSCKSSPLNASKVGGRKIVDSSSVKGSSMRFESFREEKEKVFKVDERLVSGARIMIESASPHTVDDSNSE